MGSSLNRYWVFALRVVMEGRTTDDHKACLVPPQVAKPRVNTSY